jgi:hypothetical protein
MFGNILMYAANRATQGAVGNIARQASWGGVAVLLLLAGGVFSLIVAYLMLDSQFGAPEAGVILAAVCFVAGLICLSIPGLLEKAEKKAAHSAHAVQSVPVALSGETAQVVHDEMTDAVDYFGAVRVVGSAFLLGLGIARKVKHPLS